MILFTTTSASCVIWFVIWTSGAKSKRSISSLAIAAHNSWTLASQLYDQNEHMDLRIITVFALFLGGKEGSEGEEESREGCIESTKRQRRFR